ncbi:MAG: PRC-barrel domain-containing protein [Patescibacteria group bacterium]|nr:PRC-barrel domain-containing protein [Patescibacteria group bacterium]MDD5715982.1 PRC-barrel domain-containing protein [Patescibacteria group bacterium]
MIIRKGELINLPVVTQSGQQLGRVADFEMDAEEHTVVRYIVKPGTLLADLLESDLVIAREQVVAITADRMIVEDAVVTAKNRKGLIKKAIPAT